MSAGDSFDPRDFGFVLVTHAIAPDVRTYEYANHAVVDGTVDPLRLNLYLTLDGDYCNAWWGMLERMVADVALGLDAEGYADVMGTYEDVLFKGYLDTRETATHVLKALRVDGPRYASPQVLSNGPRGLSCDVLA